MNRRKMAITALAFLCLGTAALGVSFTWSGNGSDDAWDTCDNWDACDPSFLRHWPQGTSDDAIVSGTYNIDLIDGIVTIDDLTLSGGGTIVFGDENDLQYPRLHVDVLTIQGGSVPGTDTIVRIENSAVIETYSN